MCDVLMLFSVLTDMVQLLEIKQIQIAAIREACAGDAHTYIHTYIHTYSFAKQNKTEFTKRPTNMFHTDSDCTEE